MTRPLTSIFRGDAGLSALVAAAEKLRAIDLCYRQLVPAVLAQASRVTRLVDGELYVAADNASIALKIKQLVPRLLEDFRLRFPETSSVRVAVQLRITLPRRRHGTKARQIGNTGKAALHDLAERLDEGELQRALQRLLKKSD